MIWSNVALQGGGARVSPCAAIIAFAMTITVLGASVSAQELLVPIDNEARLESISAELERKLALFPDIEDFLEARLFERRDSSYVLVIDHGRGGTQYRSERILTREAMHSLRREVTARAYLHAPEIVLDREGRTTFIATTAALGAGFWGRFVPEVLGLENDRQTTGAHFLTAGLSFVVPYVLTRNTRVSEGMAALAFQGGFRGLLDGFFVADLAGASNRRETTYMLLFSLGELGAGYVIADAYSLDAGRSTAIAVGGNLGLGLGSAAAVMIKGGDAFDGDGIAGKSAGLAGSALGYAAAAMVTRNSHYTTGDANVLTTFAVMGAAVPSTVLAIAGNDELANYGTGWFLCGAAAILYGHYYLEHRDFLTSDATYVQLASAVGALVGAGVGVILEAGWQREGRVLAATTMLGALGGFGLSLAAYERNARANAQSYRQSLSWRVMLNPAGLVAASIPGAMPVQVPVPLLEIHARF